METINKEENKMTFEKGKQVLHRANTRGVANHGWLLSKHTFSFANYFDPQRVHFGALRVLNDDIVQPGMGFGTHPHDNMEIVSIPLTGTLAHKDSTGSAKQIHSGEVQIMSAGSGITHSEYNHSDKEMVNFLQIWVFPKQRNIEPRYDQKYFNDEKWLNQWQTIVAPEDEGALWINQDAYFTLGQFNKNVRLDYPIRKKGNGVYVFVIEGSATVNDQSLNTRDGLGVSETAGLHVAVNAGSNLLLIEVPMAVN